MYGKNVTTAIIGSFFFAVSCNSYDEKHIYIDTRDKHICYKRSQNGSDKFTFEMDNTDFDGESTEIYYKGKFNKDSVDHAVQLHFQKGTIPAKHDLY